MTALNAQLEDGCRKYLAHKVAGKPDTVGELYRQEQTALYPLPIYPYDPAKRAQAKVSAFCTVRYDTNNYSVPVQYCGKRVTVKALPEQIEIYLGGELLASHQRCFDRQQNIYSLEHYLPLLQKKGRAVFQAKPVRDNVPDSFLDWLKRQELNPKGLVALLEQSLVIGFDAVMRGEVPTAVPPTPEIHDVVQVAAVDLSAYDALCRGEVAV